MEKFYFEVPGIERKEDAIEYIKEFYDFKSNVNVACGLQKFLDDYGGWLDKLQEDYTRTADEVNNPAAS